MCVKLNSLFDSEMKVFYVTQVLKQDQVQRQTDVP